MNAKTIFILGIILFILVGISIYPLLQSRLPGGKKNVINPDLPFETFTKDSISRIEIAKHPNRIMLIKDGDVWKISSYSASIEKIDSLFSALKQSTVENIVSRNISNQDTFNLASDSGTFISFKNDSGEKTFILGKSGPQSGSFYAKKDGGSNVYLVNGPLSESVFTTVSEWRNKIVANVPFSSIKTIEITGASGFNLAKEDKGAWELSVQSSKKTLEDTEVSSTLNYIGPMEGSEFTDEKETMEFEKEKRSHIIFKDKDQKILSDIEFLNKDAYYWVRSDSNPYVLKVPGYKLDTFLQLVNKGK